MTENVVALKNGRMFPPVLTHGELRLGNDNGLMFEVFDAQGNRYWLGFALVSVPDGFDPVWLQQSWADWRDQAAVVA